MLEYKAKDTILIILIVTHLFNTYYIFSVMLHVPHTLFYVMLLQVQLHLFKMNNLNLKYSN